MRILHISSARTFGGGERHLVDLCRALTDRGHEVFVALRPTNEWQNRLDFLPHENFLHVSIRNSFGMFSAKKIARFVEKNGIDIVHAHVARDYIAASVAARTTKGVKMVLTRHVVFPLKPFHRFALRNVDAAIAVSSVVGRELARIFPAEKIRHIPNGIFIADHVSNGKLQDFRSFHSMPEDAPLIVTLGELKQLKGQRDFVLAANEVAKRFPTCRFVVAGKDNSIDQRFRRELKRLVRVFGLEERFLWLDWLDDIRPLLRAADIFVSPSHSESFGLAILDAMAAGTPVITTATDGAKELIDDKRAIVPIKDPLTLAERICWFLENDDARCSLAEKLKVTAREKFGLSRMVDATEALYTEVVSARS
ncbi:MAG: glycosyltransferase family 4 protein [Pyrinomonadaceae bacterium]